MLSLVLPKPRRLRANHTEEQAGSGLCSVQPSEPHCHASCAPPSIPVVSVLCASAEGSLSLTLVATGSGEVKQRPPGLWGGGGGWKPQCRAAIAGTAHPLDRTAVPRSLQAILSTTSLHRRLLLLCSEHRQASVEGASDKRSLEGKGDLKV